MNDNQIAEDQFELYEAVILSGQVSNEDVPFLLSINPKFRTGIDVARNTARLA